MPIYEYRCPKCGVEKEVVRGIKDPEVVPACVDGTPMERAISTKTSFVLKGGSWARDGYSSKGKK